MRDNYSEKFGYYPDKERLEMEALLTEYREMREEIRLLEELTQKRASRGITAIGFVIGYALLAPGGTIFVTVVPVMIGFLFLLTIQSTNTMFLLGRQVYDIEESIPVENFGWEHRYGGFLLDNERSIPWSRWQAVNLVDLPIMTVHAIAAAFYLGSVGLALYVIQQQFSQSVAGIDPLVLTAGAYLVLTALLGSVAISFFTVQQSLQP